MGPASVWRDRVLLQPIYDVQIRGDALVGDIEPAHIGRLAFYRHCRNPEPTEMTQNAARKSLTRRVRGKS
jgi:hypothetical protein